LTALHWVRVNADLNGVLQRDDPLRFSFFCCGASEARRGGSSSSNTIVREIGSAFSRAVYGERVFHRFELLALHRLYNGGHIHSHPVFRATECPVQQLQWKTCRCIVGYWWIFWADELHLAVCAGFAADASTQCVRCSPCPTGVNAACGHNETEHVTFASTQYVSMRYAACVGRNKFFNGTWGNSTTKTTCECVTNNPQQNRSQLNNSVCHELNEEHTAGCSADQKTVVSFSANPNLILVGTRVRARGNPALLPCLAMCQTDDMCSCVGTYSVNNSGFVSGPGCFYFSLPCQIMSISQVRAALLQPSPEFLDSVVYTKAATACLTCPPGARPGTYGTCICDIAGTFSNFEKFPTCSDAASGELQSQDRMPLGMPMPQAIEHCAAAARAYAAPMFCVTVPSGKCAIYFPKNTSEVCAPSRDDIECFVPVLMY